uniref:Uncharacterized protein n=1 Tax=Rhizophora mucronata TaxID=61149 RepID=A0A2P2PJB3_RHIMU
MVQTSEALRLSKQKIALLSFTFICAPDENSLGYFKKAVFPFLGGLSFAFSVFQLQL